MSRYIPVALRRSVYDRANGCCEYCFSPEFTVIDRPRNRNLID